MQYRLAFTLAILQASSSAGLVDAQENTSALEKIKLWNCATCTAAFAGIDAVIDSKPFQDGVEKIAVKVCQFAPLKDTPDLCPGVINNYSPPAFHSMSANLFGKERWCNEILNVCTHVKVVEQDLHDVVDQILATKPASLANDDFIDKLYDEIAADQNERDVIRTVQISDVHMDLDYMPGTNAQCDSLLCCRAEFPAQPGKNVAGEWGGNGDCDIPSKTFENLMEFVVSDIKPEMIFWTGDNTSHTVWSDTAESVTRYTEVVTNIIKNAIKDTDITVLPIQGNHDTWPTDEQDFSAPGINYPINHIKEYWRDWLTEEAYAKFGEYGYYSMPLELKNGRQLPAGSRLIAYNSNSCDNNNWMIWGERDDPGHQVAWLEQELLEVEAQGGLAILIGHYAPASCQHQWGVRFRALMERFQHVVRFDIVGHHHIETFQINHSMTNPDKAILFSTVGGSVTTMGNLNPAFRVYDFDAKTMLPLNMWTYYIDVDEANETGKPDWRVLHDYLEEYEMADMRPSNFRDLAERIFFDKELHTKWMRNESRQNKFNTDDDSQLHTYCGMMSSEQHEQHECEHTGNISAYGQDFKFYELGHGVNIQALADWSIGNWVKYFVGDDQTKEVTTK